VGKQYLGGMGKIDNGVVSVSSLWVDERVYYPLEVEPYTPAHHFEGGKNDPGFRTKPHIAMELVERALEMGLPFRAVVGDILYGEHRKFKEGLEKEGIPYVLSLKPSHTWSHPNQRNPNQPHKPERRKGEKVATLDTRLRTSRGHHWRCEE
jgi:SRSO17 transposase